MSDIHYQLEVALFSNVMLMKLLCNHHKGGWRGNSAASLEDLMVDEVQELHLVLQKFGLHPTLENAKRVTEEAADVANFALMIADVVSQRASQAEGKNEPV